MAVKEIVISKCFRDVETVAPTADFVYNENTEVLAMNYILGHDMLTISRLWDEHVASSSNSQMFFQLPHPDCAQVGIEAMDAKLKCLSNEKMIELLTEAQSIRLRIPVPNNTNVFIEPFDSGKESVEEFVARLLAEVHECFQKAWNITILS